MYQVFINPTDATIKFEMGGDGPGLKPTKYELNPGDTITLPATFAQKRNGAPSIIDMLAPGLVPHTEEAVGQYPIKRKVGRPPLEK